jgi:hypothetical protein
MDLADVRQNGVRSLDATRGARLFTDPTNGRNAPRAAVGALNAPAEHPYRDRRRQSAPSLENLARATGAVMQRRAPAPIVKELQASGVTSLRGIA